VSFLLGGKQAGLSNETPALPYAWLTDIINVEACTLPMQEEAMPSELEEKIAPRRVHPGNAENVAYGVGKAGVERLAADMAEELRPYSVACVSLRPRLTKTDDVLAQPDVYPDLTRAASPRFTGRAVAALAADPAVMEKTGQVPNVLDLARKYGFTDIDGTLPAPGTTEAGARLGGSRPLAFLTDPFAQKDDGCAEWHRARRGARR
jgi:hypothetical protein